jgi:hypothetical protein
VPRHRHAAQLLLNGKVLIAGGSNVDGGSAEYTAELFDPGTEEFETVQTPAVGPHSSPTATLLLNGGVLIYGGSRDAQPEIFRDDANQDDGRRPMLDTFGGVPFDVEMGRRRARVGEPVTISGSRFACMSEASGGRSQTSATNYPIAFWVPLDGGPPSVGGVTRWSGTPASAESPEPVDVAEWSPPPTAFPGPGLLFFSTNGIRSQGHMVVVNPAKNGALCDEGAPSACESGHCIDGICCTTACGPCETCGAPGTEAAGTCIPLMQGTEVAACEPQEGSCHTGVCDGAGQCALEPGCTPGAPCESNRECSQGLVCGADRMCRQPLVSAASGGGCSLVTTRAPSPWRRARLVALALLGCGLLRSRGRRRARPRTV